MTDVTLNEREQSIRQQVAAQGFMTLIGAELGKLTRGTCEMSVLKRPELLQQHGMFHGGVTAFLVDNSTTIAASTMTQQGQTVLTAEYKLSLRRTPSVPRSCHQSRQNSVSGRCGRVQRDWNRREAYCNRVGHDRRYRCERMRPSVCRAHQPASDFRHTIASYCPSDPPRISWMLHQHSQKPIGPFR
jgi:hypothetical protein